MHLLPGEVFPHPLAQPVIHQGEGQPGEVPDRGPLERAQLDAPDLVRGVVLPQQALRDTEVDLLLVQLLLQQVRAVRAGEDHGEVQLSVGHHSLQLSGEGVGKTDLHQRIAAVEVGQQLGEDPGPPHGARPQLQRAPLLLLDVGEDVLQVPLLLPHHLGKGEDELPRAGEGQCWLPVQQGAAVVLLQAVDVVAEGLLGDIQPLGRPGHVQVLGQLLKIVETDEIHGKPPCPATKFLCRKMKKSLFDF